MSALPSGPPRVGTLLRLPAGGATAVRIFHTAATIVHHTDRGECARRQAAHLTQVDSMQLLDVLLELPVGAAIPVGHVAPAVLRVLRDAPDGVARVTTSTVTRLVTPAVTPVLAVVFATCWHAGLADASEFAAYLPRLLVIPELPGDSTAMLDEADWYGVGVAVGPPDSATVVLEPEPLADWQPTAAWWRFCERFYAHMIRA